ncbi:MAG: Ig-like domain-containing protein [Sodaliphilus pleomorphus]|uniref:Ig-like domain-containing protein n=1 Tax=Sodaliphilus pleomorphus TaxID=2606626 RepID=UPI002A748519|nr:Ig-like domain-containing protein [Sodaliphilus pleomorphus]MDY2832244.1 Ig-like domain-containing protein [Sodaliphilus pleomorphus]
MKRIYNKYLYFCAFIVICVQMAYADTEGTTFMDLTYIYRVISVDKGECELSGMRYEPLFFEKIPEKVNGYTVVSIADNAFRNFAYGSTHSKNIRTPSILEFPPTIRKVGEYIFGQWLGDETSGLNTIIIHEGTEVSSNAFSDLTANLRCVYLLGDANLRQFKTKVDDSCVLILPNDGRNFTNYSNGTDCFTKVAPYGFSVYYYKSKGLFDSEKRYQGPIVVPVGEFINLTAQSYPASYGKGMTVSVENTEMLQENYAVRRETFNENSHYNCGIHSTTSFTCTNCMANGGDIGIYSYKAVKPGNTSITFSTADGTTKTFDVTVVEAQVKSIELNTDLDCVFPGETIHLSAKVSPGNAIQAVRYEVNNGSQLGWVDLDDDKIEISPEWDGPVSTMRIRAKSTDDSGVMSNICEVYIVPNKLHFREDSLTIRTGETKTNYLYFNNVSPYKVLHYKSEDENIAIADDEGNITGISPGHTTIHVYRKGCSTPLASFPVEVQKYVPVTSIIFDKEEIHVPVGKDFTLNVKVLPEDATNKRISFKYNDKLWGPDYRWYVKEPCPDGTYLEAYSNDNPEITAKCRIVTETFVYNIENLSNEKLYLSPRETYTLKPFIIPEYQNNREWRYSSGSPEIAEVDKDGCITAVNIGSAIICASTDTDGWRATIYIDVIVINKVSSISLNPSSAEGKEGEQIQINATVLPEDATNKALAWASSDKSVATVDETGLISLLKKGTAVITASATDGSNVSAECVVVVTDDSGIDDILTDKNTYVRVFNLQGVLVYEGIYSVAKLVPDYYIVVCDGKSTKVKVK